MSLLNQKRPAPEYWRSLNELADKPIFQDWMSREFPSAGSELPTSVSRRRWLQLMGASLAFGGLAGCRWEAEEFAPFTVRPQNRTPGEKQYFSTMWELAGVARPVTVTSIDGRPIKIEGHVDHPASRGASSAWDQAMILSMYDPDRSTGLLERVRNEVVPRSWDEFDRALSQRLQAHEQRQGKGLALLREVTSSPTQQRLLDEFRGKFPEAEIYEVDPARNDALQNATKATFGTKARVQINTAAAKVIACFDADPFGQHPDSLRLVRDWANRRDPNGDWMNRLYCFESHLSLTGSNADHRVPTRSSDMADVLRRLERALAAADDESPPPADMAKGDRVIAALANDLKQQRGHSLLLAGSHQPQDVHELLLRINHQLDNFGSTLELIAVEEREAGGMVDLLQAIERKRVDTLLVVDANPAFGTEFSAAFCQAVRKVPFSVHAGTHRDETAECCRWSIPLAHALESWQDGRSFDGTLTVGQPLIEPLFEGRSAVELLAQFIGSQSAPQVAIRETLIAADERYRDDKRWRRVIHDGFVELEERSRRRPSLSPQSTARLPSLADSAAEFEVVVTHSGTTFDGRFANNGWLQETPAFRLQTHLGQRGNHEPRDRAASQSVARERRSNRIQR